MTVPQGYPRDFLGRVAATQRATQAYRGVRPFTQWLFVKASRRNNLGFLDFENGWDDDDDAPAQFCMDENGRVRLRGVISGGTTGAPAFTLPEGFRPAIPQRFALARGAASTGIALIDVDGTVTITG